MTKSKLTILSAALIAAISMSGCGSSPDYGFQDVKGSIKGTECSIELSGYESDRYFKAERQESNPLITNIFCADPTSVEYNGRLYVYATNDDQQYREKGDEDNTYEKIKSLVILSTDDMVNWRYEGIISTGEIAPWITASWAPSVVSRTEDDGLTHFYLYFSNSGGGVGVLTSTDPVGPWTDPLGKNLVDARTKGIGKCSIPFDPGVCIDENGVGWLAFGGGDKHNDTTDYLPGNARIVQLGEDMISLGSDISEINAPYHFEANELNYINGTYVYTFCNSWVQRTDTRVVDLPEIPPICSMCYMTTKTPLDTDSWEYRGYYLKNPGELGMEYGNNHTHLHKYNNEYYLFYHTQILQKERGINHGFRSVGVDRALVNETDATIQKCFASRSGTDQIKYPDAYSVREAEENFLTDCEYMIEDSIIFAHADGTNIIGIKGVDLSEGCTSFAAKLRGKGQIEIRPDSIYSQPAASMAFSAEDWKAVSCSAELSGIHDIFIVCSGSFDIDEWTFAK